MNLARRLEKKLFLSFAETWQTCPNSFLQPDTTQSLEGYILGLYLIESILPRKQISQLKI